MPDEVKHNFDVLRRHCDAASRDYDRIERPCPGVDSRDAAAAKRERLTARGLSPDFVGTESEAIDRIEQYQDASVELLINGDRNDAEARELFAWKSCRALRDERGSQACGRIHFVESICL